MYRSIVVPLDGTAFGEHALPIALDLARRAGARLHLMHAHERAHPGVVAHVHEQSYLNDVARRLRAVWNGPIEATLIDEPITAALCDYAAAARADLIVMSTHARAGLLRLWQGCVADAVVRHTPVPVLLLRPTDQAPALNDAPAFKRILIPLDGSALAERILPHAVALGRLARAEYVLAQAIEPPPIESVGNPEQGLEGLEQRAGVYLDGVAARMRAEDLPARGDIVVAERGLAAALLEYAGEQGFDLIAMETHGRHGLSRALAGSVTEQIMHGARVPLLLHCPATEKA